MLTALKILVLLTVGFVLHGCSSSNNQNDESKKILRITVGSPQTIDQHLMTGAPGWDVVAALNENLIRMNYNTMQAEPALAKSWTVSEDGKTFRFQLRENAKWSNGDPVLASDVVYTWKRMLSPALGNQYATDYYAIKNAEAFHTEVIKDFSVVGVSASGQYEVTFLLERYDPLFLKRLSSEPSSPVHPATIEKHGAIDDPTNPWTRAGNHVGNGPFRLVEWELNRVIKTEKNPYYWNASAVKLDGVYFDPAETDVIEERQYRAGNIDLAYIGRVPAEKLDFYSKNKPDEIIIQPSYATYFYLFNTQKAPFDNVNVRRAFTYAIDRELITKNVTKNSEPPAFALSPVSPAYTPPKVNLYNPDMARKFLAEAGYPNGQGFPSVTVVYNTMDSHRKIAVALQQMWKKELNVDIQLENQEWKVFLNTRQNLEHQIARAGSSSSFIDPADFLDSFVTGHGRNDAGWANADFDALIEKASYEVDEKARMAYLYKAEEIMLDQLPIMPLFYYVNSYLKSPAVTGFEFNIGDRPYYVPVDIVEPNNIGNSKEGSAH